MAIANVDVIIRAIDQASGGLGGIRNAVNSTSKSFGNLKTVMMAAGIGIMIALGKMTSDYAKTGDEIYTMSKKTGIATESLSELRYVAQITNVEFGAFESAIRIMQRGIIDASQGLGQAKTAFETLGISVEGIRSMKPEEQFWTIRDAIASIEDPTLKAALAQDIFGRSGTNLLPLIEEQKESVAGLRQEAHDLNLVFDEEAAAAANKYQDSKDRLVGALTGIRNEIGEKLMPAFTTFFETVGTGLKTLIGWMDEKTGVGLALRTLMGIIGGALVIMAIGKFVDLIMIAVGGLKTLMITLIGVQAMAGPGGWVTLGLGIAQMVAATALISQLFGLGLMPWSKYTEKEAGVTPEAPEAVMPPPPSGYASWDVYMAATGEYERRGGGPQGTWLSEAEKQADIKSYLQSQGYSLQHGGIVPGPYGQPRLVLAHGGEAFGGMGGGFGSPVYITVQGSVISEGQLIDKVRQELIRIKNRNVTSGV